MSQAALDVQSAVVSGGAIPSEYTCDGANHLLPLTWSDPPAETKTFTIMVHDPDAPRGDFVHWIAWNLPPSLRAVDQSTPDLATQGKNDFGKVGWGGPCPPRGHGPHRYVFEVAALDTTLELGKGASRNDLEAAMRGHTLAKGQLVARYER